MTTADALVLLYVWGRVCQSWGLKQFSITWLVAWDKGKCVFLCLYWSWKHVVLWHPGWMLITFHWLCDLVAFLWLKQVSIALIAWCSRLLFTKVFVLTEAWGSNLSAFVLFLYTGLATIQAVCLIMRKSLQRQCSILLLQAVCTRLKPHYFGATSQVLPRWTQTTETL